MTTDPEALAARAIRSASIAAAGLAVVLSPIPFADEAALLPVYAWLTVHVARARGSDPRAVPWRPLARAALVGLAVRATVNAPLATIPVVAAAMNAATAVALTQIYGAYVDHVCRDPSSATRFRAGEVLDAFRARRRRSAAAA